MGRDRLSDAVHVELLASVFATVAPPLVMSALFAGVGGLAAARTGDGLAILLYAVGLAATVARVAVLALGRHAFRHGLPGASTARRVERQFAVSYLAFAAPFGLFAARLLWIGPQSLAPVAIALVVGYAAGVATGVAMRPRIGVPAMLLATVPAIAVAAAGLATESAALAVTLASLLGGGIRSTMVRYRAMLTEIAMRHAHASLARTDPLTGLPNRLALDEHLAALSQAGVAATVYCVDLDGFKPVNDRFGHPAGDGLLREVAGRLEAQLWSGDMAARLGGDEFVLVRPGAVGGREREVAKLRVAAGLSDAFWIGDEAVAMSASVGASVLEARGDPRQALARADEDLYRAKRDQADRDSPLTLRRRHA